MSHTLGVNITAFACQLALFLAQSRFPAFHSKCPAFICVFRVEKSVLYALCSATSGIPTTQQPASSAGQSKFSLQKWYFVLRFAGLLISCDLVRPRRARITHPGLL